MEYPKPQYDQLTIELEFNDLKASTLVEVIDQETYDSAVKLRTELAEWYKSRLESWAAIKRPVLDEVQNLDRFRRENIEPIDALVRRQNQQIVMFAAAQETARRVEQARLDEQARQQEEAARIALADTLEKQGAPAETVEAVLETPQVAPRMVASPTYEKSSSVIIRQNWKGEVKDMKKFIAWLNKNPGFLNLVQPNLSALNAQARASKDTMQIPGVVFFNDAGVAGGRR